MYKEETIDNIVQLLSIYEAEECPFCGGMIPPFETCPHCGEPWKSQ